MSATDARPTKLVVGFDGGIDDRCVAEVALDAARALGASVEVVHSTDLASGDPPDDGPSRVTHAATAARIAERVHLAERELTELRTALVSRAQSAVEVTTRVVDGRPHEALRTAGEASGSWIVVGARQKRTMLAPTVDQVLRLAVRPVLVVPDCIQWNTGGPMVAGIDAGQLDAVVLKTAEAVATRLSRRLGVVHVRTTGDESTMLRVTEHVRAIAPSVSSNATLSVMRVEGSIAGTLADYARRIDAGLLVIGTHGRRAVERWALGSTAEALAHTSTTPFLVVR